VLDPRSGWGREDLLYAVPWLEWTYLIGPPVAEGFEDVLRCAREAPAGADCGASLHDAALRSLAAGGWQTIDEGFRAFVGRYRPLWEEESPYLQCRDDRWVQVGATRDAAAWWVPAARWDRARVRGSVQVLEGETGEARLLLRGAGRTWAVRFRAGSRPALVPVDRSDGALEARCAPFAQGEWTDFTLESGDGRVRLAVRGAVGLDAPLRGITGAWGVGAARGSAVLWRGVRADAP
jgi:hypothetical protein